MDDRWSDGKLSWCSTLYLMKAAAAAPEAVFKCQVGHFFNSFFFIDLSRIMVLKLGCYVTHLEM